VAGKDTADTADTASASAAADRRCEVVAGEEQRHDATVFGPGLPVGVRDGIEERRTGPAVRDDPAELTARLDELRGRVATAQGTPAQGIAAQGTPVEGWRTVGVEQAAGELADRGAAYGVDLTAARAMVTDYLRETTERAGLPTTQWGLDQGDLDAIAADHQLPTKLPPATGLATAAALAAARLAAAAADQDTTERARADQLTHWHTTDHGHTADHGHTHDGHTADSGDHADDGAADEIGGPW
jgi:hypothetical protein